MPEKSTLAARPSSAPSMAGIHSSTFVNARDKTRMKLRAVSKFPISWTAFSASAGNECS